MLQAISASSSGQQTKNTVENERQSSAMAALKSVKFSSHAPASMKAIEEFCVPSGMRSTEIKQREIFSQLTRTPAPVSVSEALQMANSKNTLTRNETGVIAKAQKERVSHYNAECRRYFPEGSNNWEHIVPQDSLIAHHTITNREVIQDIKMVNTLISNNAIMYLENKNHHERHTGTRWLIVDRRPVILPVSVHESMTEALRHTIRTTSAENCPYPFDQTLNMHRIDHQGSVLYFNEQSGIYYCQTEQKDFFLNSRGQPLRKVNCEKGTSVAEIIQHEMARTAYARDMATLVRLDADPSLAMQLNQLHYACDPTWQQERHSSTESAQPKANAIADASFFNEISKGSTVTHAEITLTAPPEDYELELKKTALSPEDKIEAIVSRLASTLGRYPSLYEMKEIVRQYSTPLSEGLALLNEPARDEDKEVPFHLALYRQI